MFLLKSTKATTGILIPESIEEITPELLGELTKNVKLSPYYALIATVAHVSLFELAMKLDDKHSKDGVVTTNIIAKYNIPEKDKEDCLELSVGDTAILTRTAFEMSAFVTVGSCISMGHVFNYIKSDQELCNACGKKTYDGNLKFHNLEVSPAATIKDCSKRLYTIDFRIIPINDIHAIYDRSAHLASKDPMAFNPSSTGK